MDLEHYKSKISKLRTAPNSPHKICMLLAVLDLVRSGLLTTNRIEYSQPLLERYTRYFNAVKNERNHPNPYFPFYHLSGNLRNGERSFWHLVPPTGKQLIRDARSHRDITDNISHAELDPDLFMLLQDPVSREILADSLARNWLDRQFGDLQKIVEEGKAISKYERELRELDPLVAFEPEPPEYIRSPAFRRVVLETYDYRCAATGLRLIVNEVAMVEAAHIRPFCETGDDDPRNGLALTPDMHWAMDAYLIAPGPDYKWHVSKSLDDRIPDHRQITDLDHKAIFLPKEQRLWPKQEVLEWRHSQLNR